VKDRVILAVKFTPAGASGQVRRQVGGFLRYVQHRDLHPTLPEGRRRPEVVGMLKYVAYRDGASTRAELFGPSGTLTSADRKAFAAFVASAIERSQPHTFRGRDGQVRDRRRAVYRLVISPERAAGLDLRTLTGAAVRRLEQESGMRGLRWIAAVHRNTAHPHVHLVVAGMHPDSAGQYRRVDVSKPRLAAMKQALALEIDRQRGRELGTVDVGPVGSRTARPVHQRVSLLRLQAVARRYQRQLEGDLADESRRREWELAA